MTAVLPLPAEEEKKNPFDLSSAIDLLRSLSLFHPTTAADSLHPLDAADSTTTLWSHAAQPVIQTTIIKNTLTIPSRPNPFRELLSLKNSVTTQIQLKGPSPPAVVPKQEPRVPTLLPASIRPEKGNRESRKSKASKRLGFKNIKSSKHSEDLIERIQDLSYEVPHSAPYIPRNPHSATATGIHVFVDYSNISIGFYESVKKLLNYDQSRAIPRLQFSFGTLSMVLERGRQAEKKVLVGSTKNKDLISEARKLDYEINILKRVQKDDGSPTLSSNNRGYRSDPSNESSAKRIGEQAVDEVIIMKILESLVDYVPSTIVLATGDGNVTEFSDGFYKTVERCLTGGWNIELVAFKRTLSRSWKKLISPRFRIILLDGYLLDLIHTK
ncbi:hypothetical protein H072_1812 [Dactylellina haptotyla CBS 200.50]|uniref:NYN domain-containing protein n=1 Tax=Dactylellina haptotyla (strain CBS 200.50) TaxID=1284197 RepID=S8BX99_DACHA|nr:hypothetical protein H072_1812 [Dactylellina haptotyla CBS 200.50]